MAVRIDNPLTRAARVDEDLGTISGKLRVRRHLWHELIRADQASRRNRNGIYQRRAAIAARRTLARRPAHGTERHRRRDRHPGIGSADLRSRVFCLDTPDRALDRHGVVARVRSIAGRPDDSVVKLRPVDPRGLSPRLRRSKRFVVEVDALPADFVCSGALKTRLGPHAVERAMAGQRPLRALFLEAAAGIARRAFAGVCPGRRVGGSRADRRASPQGGSPRPRTRAGRRAVDVSRRLADPRALDALRGRSGTESGGARGIGERNVDA